MTTADAIKPKTKLEMEMEWQLFDDMYDEDHSVNLLRFWIQVCTKKKVHGRPSLIGGTAGGRGEEEGREGVAVI